MSRVGLRTVQYKDADVSRLARDVDTVLRAMTQLQRVAYEGAYTEPMYLKLDARPIAIKVANVTLASDPDDDVTYTDKVKFTWEASKGRARIDDIGGMTAGVDVYLIDFLVVY